MPLSSETYYGLWRISATDLSVKIWWRVMITHIDQLDSPGTSFYVSICHVLLTYGCIQKDCRETFSWSLVLSNPALGADSEFSITFGFQTSMKMIHVEIRAQNRWLSYVFSISRVLHGKVLAGKKCQRSSTVEWLGYRIVSTARSPSSDLESDAKRAFRARKFKSRRSG